MGVLNSAEVKQIEEENLQFMIKFQGTYRITVYSNEETIIIGAHEEKDEKRKYRFSTGTGTFKLSI